jgi:hypothetical protein
MNRLTAIGLASLVAYGLLIASKYTGIVSAAHEDKAAVPVAISDADAMRALTGSLREEPAATPARLSAVSLPAPQRLHISAGTLEFRAARDLKSFADGLNARRATLTGDERFNLARALEECQFATTINDDIAAYSAKQRRQFLAGLTPGDPNAAKRIAAYDSADNTQRCLRFQGTRISQKDIEDLYAAAAQQGDPRAQARLLVADLNAKATSTSRDASAPANSRASADDMSRLVGLLETQDPEAMMIVGNFLAQSSIATQLHIGPNGEVPEPAAFLGAFSLVACDMTADCQQLSRDPQLACAFSGYCDAQTFEELYQNFLASPFAYAQASRYRNIIHTAIDTQNWGLIGITPAVDSTATQGSNGAGGK